MKTAGRLALCISAFFIILTFCSCKKAEYHAVDFADVKVVGYAEHGSLSIEVKQSTIDKITEDTKNNKSDVLRFAASIQFEYDGQDGEDAALSNGDVVTVNVTYDEELAKNLNIEILDSSFDYTVDGLEEKLEMSPFEGLSVKFSGVAPYGTVQLDKSNCIQYIIENVTFYCDDYDLSNGDKVVVRAEFNSEMAERNGYIFTEDVKKYTVVGISKYVKTMAGVSYEGTTAVMRRMVEKYVSAEDEGYKFLDWDFGGDEEEDSDVEDEFEDEALTDENSDEDLDENLGSDDSDEDNSDEDNSSAKKKRLSDSELIKADFTSAQFDASFEYSPLSCYYSLNPVQFGDNQFSATYKVTGTFVCKETNGTSYINVGDTVVGELYVITSLSGGSVDIKNKLVYEETTINNYNAYSLRSFETEEELSAEIFGNTSYLTEILDYVEDTEVYDDFVEKEKNPDASSKREVSHISEVSSNSGKENESGEQSKKPESSTDSDSSSEVASEVESDYYYDDQYGYEQDYDDDYYYDQYEDSYDYYE